MNVSRTSGGDVIMKNLNAEIRRIKGVVPAGLRLAATIIKIASMKKTPVDTGALKGSHYVSVEKQGRKSTAEVGVMQDYGLIVHEDLSMNHPNGGQAKFLEAAIVEKRSEILEAIRRTAKVIR